MVGGVSAAWALRDLFYACGLGFLLSCAYTAARMLSEGRIWCFVCDFTISVLGAVLYRSAAASRLYAGQPRWYTLTGCVLCFLAGYAALAPLCNTAARTLKKPAVRTGRFLQKKLVKPVLEQAKSTAARKRQAKVAEKVKKSDAERKKRLQTAQKVLYNSKYD